MSDTRSDAPETTTNPIILANHRNSNSTSTNRNNIRLAMSYIKFWIFFFIEALGEFHNNVHIAQACLSECICLSQTQVLCNTGGLHEIPTKRLPASVENLALTKNNFPVIKSDAFAGLRYLKKLSLDGNNITTIKPFAFRGLPKIREISIQHTPLATVAQFAFAGLQNITTILLSHNKILRVESNAFAGTSNCKLILLSNNPMVKIESSAFSGVTHVEHLILPSGIRVIEPDAFYGMDSVGLLKLAFMDLTELSPFTFRGLTNIQLLSLQESDLGIVCANSFDGLSHVGTLKFLNNKIDLIEELNLTASHHIRHLIFHGNHLLETPEPGAIILDGIRNISIINNHFPCGCHVHTLLDSPLSNGSYQRGDFLSRNFCISPLDVNGKAMSELDLFAIGRCQEQVTRENLDASDANSMYSTTNIGQYYRLCAYVAMIILLRMIIEYNANGNDLGSCGTEVNRNYDNETDDDFSDNISRKRIDTVGKKCRMRRFSCEQIIAIHNNECVDCR